LDLYFDGTRVTRSFAAFGGSYAPDNVQCHVFTRIYKPYNNIIAGSDIDMGIHAHTCVHDCLLLIVLKLDGEGVGDWPGGG
jgi:hypothetical protein